MASLWTYRVVFILGICLLCHSAISAAQHRSFQRINRQVREAGSVDGNAEEPKLPFDIVLETLSSMCLVLWCFVHMTVKLKDIRPESDYENRTNESLDFRPSFMVFGQKESLYRLRLMDQKLPRSIATSIPDPQLYVDNLARDEDDETPPPPLEE